MTISPIVGTLLQQVVPGPGVAEPVTSAAQAPALPATPGFDPGLAVAPGAHAAPAAPVDHAIPLRAELAPGDTPGDDIIAGLNKRWGNYARTLRMAADRSPGADGAGVDQDRGDAASWSPVRDASAEPHGPGSGAWAAIDDSEYDRHADAMARIGGSPDALAGAVRFERSLDEGGLMTAELSTGIHSIETSIKTLVSGQ